jgi:CheY-like chemotaxis protein
MIFDGTAGSFARLRTEPGWLWLPQVNPFAAPSRTEAVESRRGMQSDENNRRKRIVMAAHPKRIVCVDDNALVLKVLEWYLKSRGYAVVPCSSGSKALNLVGRKLVDAVVVDYHMPEMNGGDLAAALRSRIPEVPIVRFSGDTDVPARTLALVDSFVQKGQPDDFPGVANVLDSLLASDRRKALSHGAGVGHGHSVRRSSRQSQPRKGTIAA